MEPSSTDDQEVHLTEVRVECGRQLGISNDEEDEEERQNDATASDTNAASTAVSDTEQDRADDEDAADEEREEADEEDEEDYDADDSDEDEEETPVYSLPPLPPVHTPARVQGIATAEVYGIVKELRRQMDDPVERAHAKAMLQGDTDVLLAVAQVLQEAHLLRRSKVNDHGDIEEELVSQPAAARPSLPTGYNSWIVETPAHPRR
ncbi:hypothetical protein, conserved [Leishmania lindenbergi]|uniref:Uncharacterized protein n=1 Tax=Leishmania lindenbergi TaxID=651832 RepID=A0AAW3A2W8_9TRYP